MMKFILYDQSLHVKGIFTKFATFSSLFLQITSVSDANRRFHPAKPGFH